MERKERDSQLLYHFFQIFDASQTYGTLIPKVESEEEETVCYQAGVGLCKRMKAKHRSLSTSLQGQAD